MSNQDASRFAGSAHSPIGAPSSRLTIKQMQAHLDELAAETGVRLETWDGVPEATARLVTTDHGLPAVIYNKPLRNRHQYLSGLHEFGHYIVGVRGRNRAYGLRPEHLVDEVAAWVWAFDNSRVEITETLRVNVADTLFTYADDAGANSGNDYYGIDAVPDDLRAEYVAGLVRLGAISIDPEGGE